MPLAVGEVVAEAEEVGDAERVGAALPLAPEAEDFDVADWEGEREPPPPPTPTPKPPRPLGEVEGVPESRCWVPVAEAEARCAVGLADSDGERLGGGEREAEAVAEGVREAACEREGLGVPVCSHRAKPYG